MDEKQVSDFLFEMSEKAREKARSLIGKNRFYEGVADGINVAATTVRHEMYKKSSVDECAASALKAISINDIISTVFDREFSDD